MLNKQLTGGGAIAELLTEENKGSLIIDLVNEILQEAAEGGRLVAAIESSGALLGFVPRAEIPIPEPDTSPRLAPPPGRSPEGAQ